MIKVSKAMSGARSKRKFTYDPKIQCCQMYKLVVWNSHLSTILPV